MGLSVSIDNSRDFEPVLEMIQPGVIADVVDKGLVENKFKPGTKQRKCYIVWLVAEEDENGKNKRVFESFTVSLHEKSSLRKRLKDLGHKDFEAGVPFDLDSIIGTQRMLVMSSEDGSDGKTYVRISATMPLKKGQPGVTVPADFVRKDPAPSAPAGKSHTPAPRKPAPRPPVSQADYADQGISDEDIPF